MFKIEVDVKGSIEGHYWLNRHEDDFIQFLPAQFTRQYGELITKDELTVYKFDESLKDLVEGKLEQHKNNGIFCEVTSKIRVCRRDEAKFSADEYTPRANFDSVKAEREAIFSDAATSQTVSDLTTVAHDFGDGVEDAVQVPAAHELAAAFMSLELELEGTELVNSYPYDNEGKFLGNN